MAKEFNSIDEWLQHRGTERGGGGFLGNWKANGHIDVWLHMRRLPIALWQHQFPKPNVFDDKETGEARKVFWSRSHTCMEDETVLKKRYRRDRRTDEREVPPVACPLCKLAEVVRAMVRDGKLKWTDKIFVFKGASNPDDNVVLHAGGIYGAFSGKLDDDELDDLKEHGIKQSEAWRESTLVKENAVFCVVDNAHPEDGVQIATQTGLLGEKVRSVINDEIASKGDEGNPVKHPYCIQWVYKDERGLPFDKKYHARRIDRHKLTPDIKALISSDPPDLSQVLAPLDAKMLRATCEKYAVVDLPWDDIFGDAEAHRPRPPAGAKKAPPPPESEPMPAARPGGRRRPAPKPVEVPTVPCDECDAPMPETATKCAKCGAEYEVDDVPEKKSAPSKGGGGLSRAREIPDPDPGNGDDSDLGDIPFIVDATLLGRADRP